MLLGINMLLWTTLVGEDHLHLCERLKRLGYDGVELPVFSGSPEAYRRLGAQLADIGLKSRPLACFRAPNATSPVPTQRSARLASTISSG